MRFTSGIIARPHAAPSGPPTTALGLLTGFNDGLAYWPIRNSAAIKDTVTPANNIDTTSANFWSMVRASSASYRDSSGIFQLASSGVLRDRDFNPATLAILGTLIEAAETNACLRSIPTMNSQWTGGSLTITNDQGTAPDGSDDLASVATTFQYAAASQNMGVFPATSPYTLSGHLKQGTSAISRLTLLNGATSDFVGDVEIAWSNGVPSLTSVTNGSDVRLEQDLNGVWRISVKLTTTGNHTYFVYFYSGFVNGGASTLGWGFDVKAGHVLTSHIPTAGAATSRAADQPTKATTAFRYGANSVGNTLICNARTAKGKGTQILFLVDDGTINNRAYILRDSVGDIRCRMAVGGSQVTDINLGAVADNTEVGVGFAYQNGAVRATLTAGSTVSETPSNAPSGITTLRAGHSSNGNHLNGHLMKGMIIPEYLTGNQMRTLLAYT